MLERERYEDHLRFCLVWAPTRAHGLAPCGLCYRCGPHCKAGPDCDEGMRLAERYFTVRTCEDDDGDLLSERAWVSEIEYEHRRDAYFAHFR
jgi:hypothetical protein